MATGVGLSQISLTQLNSLSPKTPWLVQESGTYLPQKQSLADFLLKFFDFRYHGNRGWSETNFDYTVKFTNLENPRLVQESGTYLPYKLSYSQFSVNIFKLSLPW